MKRTLLDHCRMIDVPLNAHNAIDAAFPNVEGLEPAEDFLRLILIVLCDLMADDVRYRCELLCDSGTRITCEGDDSPVRFGWRSCIVLC